MPKSKAEQVAENRQRIREQLQNEPDNEELQREVMEPEGVEVEIGGSTVRLYPLSGHSVRSLMGLSNQVFASAKGDGPADMRIGGVIMEQYAERFIRLVAEATQRAGERDEKHLAKLYAEIDKATQTPKGAIDLAKVYFVMLIQNDLLEAFAPKGQAAEA